MSAQQAQLLEIQRLIRLHNNGVADNNSGGGGGGGGTPDEVTVPWVMRGVAMEMFMCTRSVVVLRDLIVDLLNLLYHSDYHSHYTTTDTFQYNVVQMPIIELLHAIDMSDLTPSARLKELSEW